MANFRQQLIQKCLVDTSSEDALVECLRRGEGDMELEKLQSYTWKFSISDEVRVKMWKTLLGVISAYPETRETIAKHRKDEATVLNRCLITMHLRSADPEVLPDSFDITRMILLSFGSLKEKSSQKDKTVQTIFSIVHQVTNVTKTEWIDTYAISRSLYLMIQNALDEFTMHRTFHEIRRSVADEVNPSGLDDIRSEMDIIWNRVDLESWLRSGCSKMLKHEKPIIKIMDRLCTGQHIVPLLKSLIVEFIKSGYNEFGTAFLSEEIMEIGMSEEGERRLVERVIDGIAGHVKSKKSGRIDRKRYTLS